MLYRILHQTIHPSKEIETIYTERIKIYDKTKAADYLNKYFTYNILASVDEVKAVTYNIEGTQIQESVVDKMSRYTTKEDNRYIKESFAYENVKDGSIIELTYNITNDNYKSHFFMESALPAQHAEYMLETPETLVFNVTTLGGLPVYKSSIQQKSIYSTPYKRYVYQYKDVPANSNESYVKNVDNYRTIIRTEFAATATGALSGVGLSSNWNEVVVWFNKSTEYGQPLIQHQYLKGIKENFLHIASEEERAKAILRFVTTNYEWNKDITRVQKTFLSSWRRKKEIVPS